MVHITYIEHNGERTEADAEVGQSMMMAAVGSGVAGIAAVCGGNCACGTCRIYVDESWLAKLPAQKAEEREMLDYTGETRSGARLSCQIPVTPELDGITVHLPEDQMT